MSNIAKLVTITPLHKPPVPPSPVYSVPLAPRNIPENSIPPSDMFESPSGSEVQADDNTSDRDIWTRFSSPDGFYDENGCYYPPLDPPMDLEDLKRFAEKYFTPVHETPTFVDAKPYQFDLTNDLISTPQESTILDFLFGEHDSPPASPEEFERILSELASMELEWPAGLLALSDNTEFSGNGIFESVTGKHREFNLMESSA